MPIYEFRCEKCGMRFEKLCPVGESGKDLRCPSCDHPAPKRVMSGFAACGCDQGNSSGGCGGCAGGSCGTCH